MVYRERTRTKEDNDHQNFIKTWAKQLHWVSTLLDTLPFLPVLTEVSALHDQARNLFSVCDMIALMHPHCPRHSFRECSTVFD
jgi:hypothetical protein